MFKNRTPKNKSLLMVALALLLVCTMTVTAVAAVDLSTTVGVSGLTVTDNEAGTNWTGSSGGATWSGKTGSTTSGGCNSTTTYTPTNGKLTLTNNSGGTKVLSFDYSLSLNGGSFKIAGASKTSGGSFSATLANGASVILEVASADGAANTTTVTLSNIKLAAENVTITFAPAANGSYTMNGTAVTANTSVTNPNTTTYKLVATPAGNYCFDGWYLGETKVSENATENALAFSTSGTVTAKFVEDPLYAQAKVPEDSEYTKDQLVTITSTYLHDSTEKLVADDSFPGNNSAYSKTATSGTKDKIDVQYIPSRVWSDSMGVSYSNTAMGDYVDGGAQESYAYARVLSDVIRIYAKENCNISFDYTSSHTTGGSTAIEKNANSYFYTYITTSSNATIAQIKGGTVYTGSGSTGTIALSKGNYLYILAEGYARNRYMAALSASQFAMEFDYSASISNFSVEINQKKDVLTAGFRDNTGKVLGSGTINVNGAGQSIGSNGNMADMTFADLAAVELKVGSAPANYVHIGWEITPKGGSTIYQYTATYSRTLTEDVTVNALFVPKTTITMGANGYAEATYKDFNGNALNGQYVARNASCTAYYTSLADAFNSTDVVVLLAGSTINGNWTIPSGKTFVIPHGINDNGSTTPTYAWGMGGDYCLVNLNGNLTVDGTLLVNGQQNQSTGAVGGNPGHLVVASGKTITVSGSLYAYGSVTGDGKVEAASSAKIHETMEFSDNTVVIYIYNIYNERSSKKVMPFNTMFINSIEIPVTYQQGATLTGHVAIRYDYVCAAEVPIIAPSGAMMNHTAGAITKYYDKNDGQFVFRYNEGSVAQTGSFSISMDATIAGITKNITMKSSDYYVPLSAPFRFEVAGSLTIDGKYKALPGMTIDVEKSGTLTIADGSELVLYRRNDFDYRGKHYNSTEQWGYTEVAYPQNPQHFNGVSYPFSFSNTNMGSAKLNVDGTLIVKGGLYVTDELHTAITATDDGYNYLTGTGRIDMGEAQTGTTAIHEVMRASGTNDLAWDTTAVVSLKGLKADATADTPENYETLTGQVKGFTNANGLNVWGEDPCADGHDEVTHEAKAPTCDQIGWDAYVSCSRCDYTTYVEKPAPGHSFTNYVTNEDATCVADGTKTAICDNCTEKDTIADVGSATGHTLTQIEAKAPTCTEAGYEAYEFCSACDYTTYAEVAATGHSYEAVVTAPTCTAAGYTTYTCACGDSYVADEVEALGHSYEAVVTAPTCTAAGYTTYTCACGDSYVADEVEALGHSYTSEETKAPTCTEAGVMTYTCACGDTYTEEIAANGHALTAVEAKAPTCTEAGYEAYEFCSACDYTTYAEVAATGHDYEAVVTAPTCTAAGYTTYTCACGDSYVADEVAALGHSYDAVVTAPTCTAAGYTTYTCACGDSYVADEVEALGHSYEAVVTAPTCTAAGYTTYTCACGDSYTGAETSALGHTLIATAKQDATCTDPGNTAYWTCSVEGCGKYFGDAEGKTVIAENSWIIPKLNHVGTTVTYKDNGDGTHDGACSCGVVVVDNQAHSYDETTGKCVCGAEKEPEVSINFLYTGKTLFLKGAVSINAYLAFEGADFLTQEYILENGGLLVWNEDDLPADMNDAVYGTQSYIAEMEYDSYYKGHHEYIATTEGIPAKEYGDAVYFRSYMLVDGEYQYGELVEYGVKAYCEGRFEKSTDTKLKSALVALLNFGSEAQKYLDYREDKLINADLENYLAKGWITQDMLEMNWSNDYITALVIPSEHMTQNFVQTESLSTISRSLFLKGAISVNYYVTLGKTLGAFENAKDVTMYFWTAEKYAELSASNTPFSKANASYEGEVELEYSTKYGWEYFVSSDPIAAKNWGDTVYAALCVTDSNGEEHCTGIITYSPDEYANVKINDNKAAEIDDVCKWMVIYSRRATIYFG